MREYDDGAEVGAKISGFWGGSEGVERAAIKSPVDAVKRFRESMNFLSEYSIDKKHGYRFAFEAKPNEPRGHLYFAVTGSYPAPIPTLEDPEHVRAHPQAPHKTTAGPTTVHPTSPALART